MARLHVMERSEAQAVMDGLHEALGRRLAVSSLAPCPVEFTAAYVAMCATQSCGKCTPCRVGLRNLQDLLDDVLENRADEHTLDLIEKTARSIYLSADCAIGYEAGEMALTAIRGFRDDFEDPNQKHACGFSQSQLVPCVAGCPAGGATACTAGGAAPGETPSEFPKRPKATTDAAIAPKMPAATRGLISGRPAR